MRNFYASSPAPLDQADGLRKLFNPMRARFIAVASNPHVAFAGVMLERLSAACAANGRHVLVVDASETAQLPHELTQLDLGAGIEALSDRMSYLAARGLPLQYVDSRGSCAGFLQAVTDAAPQADVVIVHAGASELGRLFACRAVRPLLMAANDPVSVTHAYSAMKLLAVRNGLMTFDLLLAAGPGRAQHDRIVQQMSTCADCFLGAVLHDWAGVDPASDVGDLPGAALLRLVRRQLDGEAQMPDDFSAPWRSTHRADAFAAMPN
jgi:flagellar biosynthesis protein FlhG